MTFLANKQSCSFKLAYKNFKTNFLKQCYLSVIFSISILFLLFSLSSGNIIDTAIDHFKQENITLTNGFIKRTDNIDIYQLLTNDARVDNVYKQFKLHDVILSKNNKEKLIKEKYPTPKAKQTLSYGSMPDNKKNEIALTPSLAKLFHPTIYELIGQEITLTYHSKSYSLIISGIYNAGYHDFVVSSNIEKELYSELEDNNFYSIHYDVKEFNDIVTVNEELLDKGIKSENAADQVQTLRVKFSKIQALFIISSVMISSFSMFCTIVLTIKIHNIRYKMIELLYAVGFLRKTIYHSIIYESIFLSTLVVLQSIVLFSIVQVISNFFDFQLTLSIFQILFTMLCSSVLLFIINILIGKKIINKPLYKNIKL